MSHVVRTAHRHLHALRWHARFTSTDVSSPSYNPPPPTAQSDAHQKQKASSGRPVHPRIIFVRPWDGIATMAHAFAIARDIERRFGKIQEFKVLRVCGAEISKALYFSKCCCGILLVTA